MLNYEFIKREKDAAWTQLGVAGKDADDRQLIFLLNFVRRKRSIIIIKNFYYQLVDFSFIPCYVFIFEFF